MTSYCRILRNDTISVLVPDMAKVKSYNVVEMNGFIYIWYHAENAEPYWTLPEIEQITSGQWTYGGRTEHYINAHIEVSDSNMPTAQKA